MADSIIEVKWKDLSAELNKINDTAGTYNVTITDPENVKIGSADTNDTLGYYLKKAIKDKIYFDFTNTDLTKAQILNLASAFKGCTNLYAIGNLPTTVIGNASSMFEGCSHLNSADVSSLLKVTVFTNMFNGCAALQKLNVSKIFIENAKDAANLLADCTQLKSIYSVDSVHPAVIAKNTDIQGALVVREGVTAQADSTFLKDVTVNGIIHGELDGNAATATKLKTARDIILQGDATGSSSFDGTTNATINVVIDSDKYITRDNFNQEISKLKVSTMQVVDALPEEGEEGIIYLVPKEKDSLYNANQTGNVFNEYIWEFYRDKDGKQITGEDGKSGWYEIIGDTAVDLTDYITRQELKRGWTFEGLVTAPAFTSTGDITVGNNLVVENNVVIKKGHLTVSDDTEKAGALIHGTVVAPDGFKGDLEGTADVAKKVQNPLTTKTVDSVEDATTQASYDGSSAQNINIYLPDQDLNQDSDVTFGKLTVTDGIEGTASEAKKVEHKLSITQITNGVTTTKEYDGSEDVAVTIKSSNLTTNYVDTIEDVDRETTIYDGSNEVEQNIYVPDQDVNKDSDVTFNKVKATDSFVTDNVTIDQDKITVVGQSYADTTNLTTKDITLIDASPIGNHDTYLKGLNEQQLKDQVYYVEPVVDNSSEDDTPEVDPKNQQVVSTDLKYATEKGVNGSFTPHTKFITRNGDEVVWPSSTDRIYVKAGDTLGTLTYTDKDGKKVQATYAAPFEGIVTFKSYVVTEKPTAIASIVPLRDTKTKLVVNSNNIVIEKTYTDEFYNQTVDTTIIDGQSLVINNIDATTVNTTNITIHDPNDPDIIYNITINEEGDITINNEKIILQSDYDDLLERLIRLEKKVEAFYSNSNSAGADITDDMLKNWTGLADVSGIAK